MVQRFPSGCGQSAGSTQANFLGLKIATLRAGSREGGSMEKTVSVQGRKQEGNCSIFQVRMQEKQESLEEGKTRIRSWIK